MATINLRDFPADLHKKVKIRAAEEETTIKAIIIKALTEYLKKKKKGGD
jgi:plasmid stability protein